MCDPKNLVGVGIIATTSDTSLNDDSNLWRQNKQGRVSQLKIYTNTKKYFPQYSFIKRSIPFYFMCTSIWRARVCCVSVSV